MTDFVQQFRFYCRNPRCRMRLKAPVQNSREAFCTRGCHGSFYRRRCLICEKPMERRTESQRVCGKRRCRNALQTADYLGRYHASSSPVSAPKTLDFVNSKLAPASDRPWCIVAGPELGPSALHCVAAPDGGEYERIEARNMDLLADAWTKSRRSHCAKQVEHVRQDAAPSDWKPCLPSDWRTLPDLPIPNFLRRIPEIPDIYSQLIPEPPENTETPDFIGTIISASRTTSMSSAAFST
jgi:hypothetical protein